MTKKQEKERNKKQRVLVTFNTGTKTHKNMKAYDRKNNRKAIERAIMEG